jgi:hypothetical protein
MHDDAHFYSALVVKIFLVKHGAMEIRYPPYSPDPASTDIFLFPMVKTALKVKRFQDAEDIKKIVTAEPNAVPLEAFAECFQKLFERCKKCIEVGGDCFEEK